MFTDSFDFNQSTEIFLKELSERNHRLHVEMAAIRNVIEVLHGLVEYKPIDLSYVPYGISTRSTRQLTSFTGGRIEKTGAFNALIIALLQDERVKVSVTDEILNKEIKNTIATSLDLDGQQVYVRQKYLVYAKKAATYEDLATSYPTIIDNISKYVKEVVNFYDSHNLNLAIVGVECRSTGMVAKSIESFSLRLFVKDSEHSSNKVKMCLCDRIWNRFRSIFTKH